MQEQEEQIVSKQVVKVDKRPGDSEDDELDYKGLVSDPT